MRTLASGCFATRCHFWRVEQPSDPVMRRQTAIFARDAEIGSARGLN